MTGTKAITQSADLESRYQTARDQLQQAEQAFRSHESRIIANRQALKRETDVQKVIALQNEVAALELLMTHLRNEVAKEEQVVQAVVMEQKNLAHYVRTLKDRLANAPRERQFLETKRGQAEHDLQQAQLAWRQAEAVLTEHDGRVKAVAAELVTLA